MQDSGLVLVCVCVFGKWKFGNYLCADNIAEFSNRMDCHDSHD